MTPQHREPRWQFESLHGGRSTWRDPEIMELMSQQNMFSETESQDCKT